MRLSRRPRTHISLRAAALDDRGARFLGLLEKHCRPIVRLPLTAISRQQVANVLGPVWLASGGNKGNGAKLKQLLTEVFAARLPDGAVNPAEWSRLRGLLPAVSREANTNLQKD
jgi:hypothetical protein